MSDGIRLNGTTVNAPDARALATFYADLTDGVARGTAHWAAVTGPHGFIAFQQVDDFRAPGWPEGAVPMRLYADPAGHPFCLSTWDGQELVDGDQGTGDRARPSC